MKITKPRYYDRKKRKEMHASKGLEEGSYFLIIDNNNNKTYPKAI